MECELCGNATEEVRVVKMVQRWLWCCKRCWVVRTQEVLAALEAKEVDHET